MSAEYHSDTILLIDDEPHYLRWAVRFLEDDLGYRVVEVRTLEAALEKLRANEYRAVVIDLRIPATGDVRQELDEKGAPYKKYPGLYVADYARHHSHRGRQVIVYSVYDDDAVREQGDRLNFTYLLKGRPREFKRELEDVLSYDPLEEG